MSEMFFTTPKEVDRRKTPTKLHWEHKEQTIKLLMERGVPLRPAELSAIDNRQVFAICQRNKMTPEQTVDMIYDYVVQRYKRNGEWLHA